MHGPRGGPVSRRSAPVGSVNQVTQVSRKVLRTLAEVIQIQVRVASINVVLHMIMARNAPVVP